MEKGASFSTELVEQFDHLGVSCVVRHDVRFAQSESERWSWCVFFVSKMMVRQNLCRICFRFAELCFNRLVHHIPSKFVQQEQKRVSTPCLFLFFCKIFGAAWEK